MAALKPSSRHRSEEGAVLIEAAIALPLLLLVVLGIIDFGLLFRRYEVVTNAAREGARIAMLDGYSIAPAGANDAEKRVRDYLVAGGLSGSAAVVSPITRSPVRIGGSSGPCVTVTTVTVAYPHTYSFVGGIIGFFGGTGLGPTNLTAKVTMRFEGAAMTCS
jgi:Flp pilus assembly protein TadG